MIRKLLLLFIALPLFCAGQTEVQEYHGDINYKDIIERNDLIYFRADTTLVSGRVIRYNRKNEAKKYVLVSNGKPDKLGWIHISDNYEMPKESGLGDILTVATVITGAVLAVTDNNVKLPIGNDNKYNKYSNQTRNYLSEQKDNTLKAYSNMSDRNDISKNINSIKEKRNGSFEEYNKDGQIKVKGNFIEEKKNGIWEEYYDNGQLMSKGNYINGKKDGLWREYLENGQTLGRINYKDGKEHGIMEVYHKNGQLMIKGLFKDAIQIGEWNYYDEGGKLIKTEKFDN